MNSPRESPEGPLTIGQLDDPRVLQSRRALVDAATTLLRASGPSAITVNTLLKRAKVSRATMYRHYPNVNSVIAAAYLLHIPDPPPPPTAGAPLDRLIDVVTQGAEFVAESPMLREAVWWLVSMRATSGRTHFGTASDDDPGTLALRARLYEFFTSTIRVVLAQSGADAQCRAIQDSLIIPLLIAPVFAVGGKANPKCIAATVEAFMFATGMPTERVR